MPVVSLSFPEGMIRDMDELQRSVGFTGRSELVRAGVRLLLQDVREGNSLSGTLTAVVVATHSEENEETVTRIKHQFDEIVRTHLHSKIAKKSCVELFLLEGEAERVTSMMKELQKDDDIKSVKLVTL